MLIINRFFKAHYITHYIKKKDDVNSSVLAPGQWNELPLDIRNS